MEARMTKQHHGWLVLLFMLLIVTIARAQERPPTPTERAADCITNSWKAYEECWDAVPWYATPLCVLQFDADAIACVAEVLPT